MASYKPEDWATGELLPLDAKDRQRIAYEFSTELNIAISNRSQFDIQLQTYNDLYEMQTPTDDDWPWEGAANMYYPLITGKMFDLEAQMSPLFFTTNPFYVVNPKKSNDSSSYNKAPIIQSFLDADTWDEDRFLNWQYYTAFQLGLRDGVGILELIYAEDKRRRRVPTPHWNETLSRWETKRVKQDITVFSGVVARPCPLRHFYLLPANAGDIERAFGTGRRIYLNGFQIKRNIERGYFYPDAEAVLGTGGVVLSDRDLTYEYRIGATPHFNPLYRDYELFEVIMPGRYKNEEDVWEEDELCVLLDRNTFTAARIELPTPSKKKKYHAFTMIPRPDQFLGWGVPELGQPIQEEFNASGNNALDAQGWNLNVPLFTTANNLVDPNKPIGPGTVHIVQDPKELFFPPARDVPLATWQEKQELIQMLDRVLGTADITSMLSGAGKKTRAEIMAVAQSLAGRSQVFSSRLRRTLQGIGSEHLKLIRRYGPDDLNFTAKEANGIESEVHASKKDLMADVRIMPNGSIRTFDQSQKEQMALFRYQMLMQNPLIMATGKPQQGPDGQSQPSPNWSRVWEVAHDFLVAQDVKNIEALIGKKEELPDAAERMGPQGAFAGIMSGINQGMKGGGPPGGQPGFPSAG